MKKPNQKTWYYIVIAACLLMAMFALRQSGTTQNGSNLVGRAVDDSHKPVTFEALPQLDNKTAQQYPTTNIDSFESVSREVTGEAIQTSHSEFPAPSSNPTIQPDQHDPDSDRPSWAIAIPDTATVVEAPLYQSDESLPDTSSDDSKSEEERPSWAISIPDNGSVVEPEEGRPSWAVSIPDNEPAAEPDEIQPIEVPLPETPESEEERPSWAVPIPDAEPITNVDVPLLEIDETLQAEDDNFSNDTAPETAPETESPILTASIPDLESLDEVSPVLQVNQESVLEPLSEFESQAFIATPEVTQLDQPDRPISIIEPTASEETGEIRIAALPVQKEKPKFKKFGASKSKSKDSDEDEDDDPPAKQPGVLSASKRWKLAATPKKGDRYKDDTPLTDSNSLYIEGAHGNFSPTPTMQEIPYDPYSEMNVYQGKELYANQRPLLELGRPWYQLGPISEGSSILGFHNNVNPQYLIFGDLRTGFASNRANGDTNTLTASQLNLFHHFKFTSTERFVAGMTPLSQGQNSTRFSFDDDEFEFEGNADFNFAFIEGDLGAIAGGATGQTLPFDLPFAAGIIPLVFQNGIWLEDEILGFAVTIPARNSPRLDISNMDITFFAGYDRLNSPAFEGDDSAARVIGVASFLDALNGHFEIDYAFLDDRTNQDRSYHNFGFGYTRRYGRFLSNSTRIIVNAGQQNGVPGSADGVLLLSENSLITGFPSTVVPYLNLFAGFDQPQSVGRNNLAGGILRNTGILFESDNLTGYPTLDATANDTFGFALGLNLLADEFAQQLIVEAAALGVIGDNPNRNALGDQYGVGVRYQLPLTNSVIFRADAMVGFLRNDEDINGGRMEIRKKF